jgi:hypothetical protein
MKSSIFLFLPSVHVTSTPVAQITRVTSSAGGVAGSGSLGGIALVRACRCGWWRCGGGGVVLVFLSACLYVHNSATWTVNLTFSFVLASDR